LAREGVLLFTVHGALDEALYLESCTINRVPYTVFFIHSRFLNL
jgi:hypothetical protein